MDPPNPSDLAPDPSQLNGAYFGGESDEYRYLLWRTWDPSRPRLLWVLLNPSTADAEQGDNTVACCIRFTKCFTRDRDYGGLEIVNLFAFHSKDPNCLYKHPAPIGPANDRYIAASATRAAARDAAARIVVAWGERGLYCQRDRAVLKLLTQHPTLPLHCLGTVQNGSPRHPARLSGATRLVPFPGYPAL